ncbi:MAG TPA: HAD-IIIA family hydrolase [Chitinophagaceae bacterium]|jgi:D-glycero-D-manno-heptose 1,7-bisphosphate phosphatase|nr:HAD-IIIA family hydrolase [Chitinophagaceae bacterium]
MLDLRQVNKDWSLFLDRDGVLNHDKVGSYIFNTEEFRFYDGVTEALRIFNRLFAHIVVVTNQRGVGKGLMSELDLMQIHNKMLQDTEATGGRIDAIYYAISLDNNHPERKPHPGMALKAKEDIPEIDFSKSIMVGNNISDMEFARNTGMHAVFIKTTQPKISLPHPSIDLAFNSLLKFAEALEVK